MSKKKTEFVDPLSTPSNKPTETALKMREKRKLQGISHFLSTVAHPGLENAMFESPATTSKKKKMMRFGASKHTDITSAVLGFVGALLGASVFLIPYFFAFAYFGRSTTHIFRPNYASQITAISTSFIAWGATFGYEVFKGNKNKVVKRIVILSATCSMGLLPVILNVGMLYHISYSFSEAFKVALADPLTITFCVISLLINILSTLIFLRDNDK